MPILSSISSRSSSSSGIGPVDPYDPGNPLNSPAPGNPNTTAPYNPSAPVGSIRFGDPTVQLPTDPFAGARGGTVPSQFNIPGYGNTPFAGYGGTPTAIPTGWAYDPDLGYVPRALPVSQSGDSVPNSTTGYVPGVTGTGAPYYNPFTDPGSSRGTSPFGYNPSGSAIPWGEGKLSALLGMGRAGAPYTVAPGAVMSYADANPNASDRMLSNPAYYQAQMQGGGGANIYMRPAQLR